MGKREEATAIGVRMMAEAFPGSGNAEMLKADLDALSDKEFTALMQRLAGGDLLISATIPNLGKTNVSTEHFKAIGKKWEVEFFHHITMTDPDTGRLFTTPHRYMVVKLPIGRLAQMQELKTSFPEDNTHVDEMTGQVTGDSKGSKISFPEFGNMLAQGETYPIIELMKIRGGDEAANRQFEYDIANTGIGNIDKAMEAGEGVTATKNLATLLRAGHLSNTLDKK